MKKKAVTVVSGSQYSGRVALLIFLFFLFKFSSGQTIVISEDFESGLGAFSQSGANTWSLNNSVFNSGVQSAHNTYSNNSQSFLELTNSIDLTGYNTAILEFYQIAKIEIADTAIIQISVDNGNNWTTLSDSYYTGNGFMLDNTRFFDASYPEWDFNNNTTPDNLWWKKETFDLSSFTGNAQVKIRFALSSDGTLSWYGWLIDDFKITAAGNGETDPPVIIHTPLQNTGSTAARDISATITDASGIASAEIFYRVNNGTWISNNLIDSGSNQYSFVLPGQPVDAVVDYYLKAVDASSFANTAFHPANDPDGVHTYEIIDAVFSYPYFEDFETSTADDWTHKADLTIGNTGTIPYDDWQLGNPDKFYFTDPYSGNNAYVTQLVYYYSTDSRSSLISPLFDLSTIENPVFSFKHMYDTEYQYDGARIDYTTDEGYSWHVLGQAFDMNAFNWYNYPQIESASDPVFRPGWNGFGADGWISSAFDLTGLVPDGSFVRFRFAFTSDPVAADGEGWMIDDIRIDNIFDYEPGGPNIFNLGDAFPNPCGEQITFPYSINQPGDLTVHLYNLLGDQLLTKKITGLESGTYSLTLNIPSLPNGNYLAQFQFNNLFVNREISVMK